MFKQDTDDINYEDIDDLPLFDHVEWLFNVTVKDKLCQQPLFDNEVGLC